MRATRFKDIGKGYPIEQLQLIVNYIEEVDTKNCLANTPDYKK